MIRPLRALCAAALAATLVAGCSSGTEPEATSRSSVDVPTSATADTGPATTSVQVELPSGAAMAAPSTTAAAPTTAPVETTVAPIDSANVVGAAMVIAAGGDIEQALLEGQFSLAEVDAAIRAIETDTLSDYLQ